MRAVQSCAANNVDSGLFEAVKQAASFEDDDALVAAVGMVVGTEERLDRNDRILFLGSLL